MDLGKINQNLLTSLSFKLNIERQAELSHRFLQALARKLHVKYIENPTLESILTKIGTFGLELDHIDINKLRNGEQYQLYFFLDVVNVLLDSIFQVKQNRIDKIMREKLEQELKDESTVCTSGGEEVSKILENASKKFSKFQRLNNILDNPQQFPSNTKVYETHLLNNLNPKQQEVTRSEVEDSSNNDNGNRYESMIPKAKKSKIKHSIKTNADNMPLQDRNIENDGHEINVKIPTSDETDVVIKVKPLDTNVINNKRIHLRINQKLTPDRSSKSNRIVYGSKSVISHHLRKSRPPLFSKKVATPKLDKKQILQNVVDFAKQAKRDEAKENEPTSRYVNSELLTKLKCQRIIREKRTKNAQLKKLMSNL